MGFIKLPPFLPLTQHEQSTLNAEHHREIESVLPVLGPIFSLGVLLFYFWDHMIDPERASITLVIRIILVGIGALAYLLTLSSWSAIDRCSLIYWTHISAIILSASILENGFLYGLTGICACCFTVSVLTYDTHTFLRILSLPAFLFIILSYFNTGFFVFINSMMMYLFTLSIAWIVMISIRSFRQKNFLIEQKLLHCSRHDSLTGTNNRAYLNEIGKQQFSLAQRHQRPFAVSVIDIDNFKRINDSYGHDIGDQVIRSLVKTCQLNLREIDHLGRLGGEEFVCILPETKIDEALICMNRIRSAIAESIVNSEKGEIRFTVSIGVVALLPEHRDWEGILREADAAMYRAKNSGKNRVET